MVSGVGRKFGVWGVNGAGEGAAAMIWIQVGLAVGERGFRGVSAAVYARRSRETAVRAAMAQVRAKQAAEWAERAAACVPFPNEGGVMIDSLDQDALAQQIAAYVIKALEPRLELLGPGYAAVAECPGGGGAVERRSEDGPDSRGSRRHSDGPDRRGPPDD
jgi:hypothetical protein